MDYSVVIPVYNEAESLPQLHKELRRVMESLTKDYEIIYVNDGSSDDSLRVLETLSKETFKIKIISYDPNRGQSAAFAAGFKMADGAWIITLDADLQNPPGEIKRLVPFQNDFDFITGVRQNRKDTWARKGASLIARLSRRLVLGDVTQDTGCSLRLFRREVAQRLPVCKNFHRFFTFLVRTQGYRIKEVPVAHQQRAFGISKYHNLARARAGIIDLWNVRSLSKGMKKHGH